MLMLDNCTTSTLEMSIWVLCENKTEGCLNHLYIESSVCSILAFHFLVIHGSFPDDAKCSCNVAIQDLVQDINLLDFEEPPQTNNNQNTAAYQIDLL